MSHYNAKRSSNISQKKLVSNDAQRSLDATLLWCHWWEIPE